jgi:HEAT repeat protein
LEFLKIGTAGYGLAENIILIEFLAIAMVIIFCYVLKLFYFLKRKRKKQYTALIESHLLELVSTKKPFSKSNFPPSWMKMDVLVIIINKLDRNISSPEWGKIRMSLLHSVVLPLARRAANSYYWILRFYAAESFSLAGEAQDEKLILSLVNDKVPLVYLNALTAALNYGAERAIDVIIKKMAQERALTQGAYLQAFSTVSSTTRPLIEKYLQKSIEPFERATCYKILNQYPADKITWDLTEDIQSNNLELKIATIRFIAYNHLKNVIPILIKLLQDPEWFT